MFACVCVPEEDEIVVYFLDNGLSPPRVPGGIKNVVGVSFG